MKHTLLFATIASFVVVHAYANNIVTSKTYVDNRDALKVDIAQGTGDNNANVGKTLVVNSSGNLELGTPAAGNYVEDSITDGVTDKAPSENAVHDALAGKQDAISTAEVAFTDPDDQADYQLPSLVAYDSTNGLSGNQIGVLDLENGGSSGLTFLAIDMDPWDSSTAVYDNYVPTVRTVAGGLRNVWDNIPSVTPITWNSNDATAVNNYSTSFTGTGNWPSGHEDRYVTGSSLAQGLALKQNKIPARQTKIESTDSTYAPSVVTNGTTDGSVGQMAILTDARMTGDDGRDGGGFANYTNADSLIPTAAAVGAELGYKQGLIPARQTKIESTDSTYAPSVVTNGSDYGSVGQMAIITDDRLSRDMRNYTDPQGWTWTLYEGDTLIPTLGAAVNVAQEVGSHLQGKLGGGSYAGKVVTATNSPGVVTYTAIDSTPTSASTNLVTSGGVYTAVNAKQAKKVCAGWPDGAEHTDANCWLWNMPD